MINKYKLSATSSLVLLWCDGKTYPSLACAKYLARLDLTDGKEFFNACNSIWKDYDQVIKNRKYHIHKELFRFVNSSETLPQVVIFGSGMCPLSLEIQSHFSDIRIYEIEFQKTLIIFHLVTRMFLIRTKFTAH
jgi:hypothetical protein